MDNNEELKTDEDSVILEENTVQNIEEDIKSTQHDVSDIQDTEQSNTIVEEKEVVEEKPKKNKQNVTTKKQIFFPDDRDIGDDYIAVPSDSQENIIENIRKSDNINLEDSEEKRSWSTTLRDGLDHNVKLDVFDSNLRDENVEFTNNLVYNNKDMGVKTAIVKSSTNTGEQAILRAGYELGLGKPEAIPLYNSGFHVVLKPYTDRKLVELNTKIAENKISLGSLTKGLVYSSSTYYVTECIIDFVREHIYNTSLALEPGDDIMDYIVTQDLSDLLWGILLTSNPSGFNYKRACTHDPANCHHVESGLLKLREAQYINGQALTDWQKVFMTRLQSRSKTKEEVLRYQKELVCMSEKRVELIKSDLVKVNILLKAPTINEYINSSRRWVMEISDRINQMFSTSSENDRDNFMIESGRSTSIRQYCHYVNNIEEIRGEDEENIISDRETIENYLTFISDEDVRNKFFDAVSDYISKSTVTVIGIPVYNCSACSKPQSQGTDVHDPVFSEIIPLDMLSYFFSHLTQRIMKIRRL